MKFILAVPDPAIIPVAIGLRPDLVEIRLDLMPRDPGSRIQEARAATRIPFILTLRSTAEGGKFSGDTAEWLQVLAPLLQYGDFVDVESRFSSGAAAIRAGGRTIIASAHVPGMPSPAGLREIERDLRAFGDIPKIVVEPRDEADLIELMRFTQTSLPPIITSVSGTRFRFARAILPFFGSSHLFCHGGKPTAEGQFHISEVREIYRILGQPPETVSQGQAR